MKNKINQFLAKEWGLFVLVVATAFIVIVIYNITTVAPAKDAVIILQGESVGSYDELIDSVHVDSAFRQLLDIYHKLGIRMNTELFRSDKRETANALNIPVDSVTYSMMVEHMGGSE
jgi:hypothetical protein